MTAESAAAVRVGVGTVNSATSAPSMSNQQGAGSSGAGAGSVKGAGTGSSVGGGATGNGGQSSDSSASQKESLQPPAHQNPWGMPPKEWRDIDPRSAPFQAGNRDTSPTTPFAHPSSTSSSSPPKPTEAYGPPPTLAAPRAVPPYPRFTSPQPQDSTARSPSPSKRGGPPFTFGSVGPNDARERWASLGQAQQNFGSQHPLAPPPQQASMLQQSSDPQRKMIPPPGSFPNEAAFLGYSDIWGNGGGPQRGAERPAPGSSDQQPGQSHSQRSYTVSSQHPDLEHLNTRFDPSNMHFARDEGPYSSGGAMINGGGSRGIEDGGQRMPFQNLPGIPASGSLSPRSLLQHHQQQIQAQQAMAMQAAQQGNGPGANQSGNQVMMSSGPSTEEITTVFIVGFPDDMTEREFANMFLFAKGFEASTLKIPSGPSLGAGPAGQGQRSGDGGSMAGPGGPYNAVNMPGSALFDLAGNGPPGGWDEHSLSLALSRAGTGDAYNSLANLGGLSGALQSLGNASNGGAGAGANAGGPGSGPGGKIKQIIGFAKFRTRAEALEARDALNGRKIDTERGCVLKTEMAKKNLHTKQRPVLATSNTMEAGFGGQPPVGFPGMPPPPSTVPSGNTSVHPHAMGNNSGPPPPPMDREMGFALRGGRGDGQGMGPGSFNIGQQGHSSFDPFTNPGGAPPGLSASNGLMSPSADGGYGRGSDFFPRTRIGQDGSQGSDVGRVPNGGGDNNNSKWAPMGPLDYYDGPQRGQQSLPPPAVSQQQHQPGLPAGSFQGSGSAPRGPDWSAIGSPQGLYASARGSEAGSYGGAKGGTSSAGPLSPYGEQPPPPPSQQQPQQQSGNGGPGTGSGGASAVKQEDFGKGESTAQGIVNPLRSPPLQGSEKSSSEVAASSNVNSTRPQSRVSSRSRQGSRTTSPVNVTTSTFVQRFGSLRIDSPTLTLNQPRPFSPNQRSPGGESQTHASIHPHYTNSGSNTNATSPTSPHVDLAHPLPSPTSRSFSIDANPPGNTLFVGNLPGSINTAPASTQLEEALRKIFSQKKGFRQMSFRVKSSGPMCFVEFDDVGCAGRALGEANGDTLDGTVKGGLRLSFSKNPLFRSTLGETGGAQMGRQAKDLLDLDKLSTLEDVAYQDGYTDGEAHGKLHGLFEGRELGTLKGFEVWEEIGFIQGAAQFWLQVTIAEMQTRQSRKQAKQVQQLESLLGMIDALPMDNDESVNLFGGIEKIRAKYKLACSSLAVSSATGGQESEFLTTSSSVEPSRMLSVHGRTVDTNKLNF